MAQVEVDGRLVEQEGRRRLGDGQGDEHQLAFAERQLADVAAEQVTDADPLDGGGDGGAIGRAGAAQRVLVRQPAESDDLLDSGCKRQGRLLRDDRQAAGNRQPIQAIERLAGQPDLPGQRLDRAGDSPQQGRSFER